MIEKRVLKHLPTDIIAVNFDNIKSSRLLEIGRLPDTGRLLKKIW